MRTQWGKVKAEDTVLRLTCQKIKPERSQNAINVQRQKAFAKALGPCCLSVQFQTFPPKLKSNKVLLTVTDLVKLANRNQTQVLAPPLPLPVQSSSFCGLQWVETTSAGSQPYSASLRFRPASHWRHNEPVLSPAQHLTRTIFLYKAVGVRCAESCLWPITFVHCGAKKKEKEEAENTCSSHVCSSAQRVRKVCACFSSQHNCAFICTNICGRDQFLFV